MRELKATQEEFKSVATGRTAAIRSRPGAHEGRAPRPGSSSTSAQQQLDELAHVSRAAVGDPLPRGEPITVAPTPDFYRWSFASMWTPGPFETKPTRAPTTT